MKIDPKKFKAPYISAKDCWDQADAFRRQYWTSDRIPVDILEVVEFELRLELRPINGLKEDADVDALLLSNWKAIVVDQRQYMEDRYINRLRFSIAHEIGHYALHQGIFKTMPRGTAEEWVAFMTKLPEDQYSFLEYHANEFAGRLLVPYDHLKSNLQAIVTNAINSQNATLDLLNGDSGLPYLCSPLAKIFAVSEGVIERRLQRERLWPISL